jgi:hypothetical protein
MSGGCGGFDEEVENFGATGHWCDIATFFDDVMRMFYRLAN